MEISSLSASTIPSLNSPNSTSNYSSKLSSFSSLQFPVQLHRLQFRKRWITSPSRPPILPLVAAKKQTFSTLDELLEKSDKPVLVDFYATWCGPCQFMAPILNEVSAVLEDTVQVVKIDTEKYPSIADKYRIEALPTFIIFKDGKPYDRFLQNIQYEASVFGFLTADHLPHPITPFSFFSLFNLSMLEIRERRNSDRNCLGNFCFKTALLELKFQRLAVSDPESCCEKLGDLLITGLLDEHSEVREGKSPLNFRLHSVHHLALSTYTTLASAYTVCASDLFALHSQCVRVLVSSCLKLSKEFLGKWGSPASLHLSLDKQKFQSACSWKDFEANLSLDEPATLSLRRKKVVVKEEEPRKKSCQGRRD
ncbi:hypothetical protein D5086_026593 [Populus alba]|uniref:Uncharacterized protein n=1 Tax=Populus alba TaxID=43335 RepID=A0ACC4B2T0_POPAL